MRQTFVCIKSQDCEKTRKILGDVIEHRIKYIKHKDNICIPVKDIPKSALKNIKYHIIEKNAKKEKRIIKNVRELLAKELTAKQVKLLGTAYDQIGDVIILDIPDELKAKETAIGKCFLKFHKKAKTVAAKAGIHSGKTRLQPLRVIAGRKNLTTTHHENNVKLKIEVGKTYFSPRSSNERKRISDQVKKGEDVLVMFSGAGPFTIVIAKNAEPNRIVGVELNKEAHKMAENNIRLNKLMNAKSIQGDAKKIVSTLGKFDRIIMPLPKGASGYINTALDAAKDDSVIHYYYFCKEDNLKKESKKEIDKLSQQSKRHKLKIIRSVACGHYSPGIVRACIDIKVKKKHVKGA